MVVTSLKQIANALYLMRQKQRREASNFKCLKTGLKLCSCIFKFETDRDKDIFTAILAMIRDPKITSFRKKALSQSCNFLNQLFVFPEKTRVLDFEVRNQPKVRLTDKRIKLTGVFSSSAPNLFYLFDRFFSSRTQNKRCCNDKRFIAQCLSYQSKGKCYLLVR